MLWTCCMWPWRLGRLLASIFYAIVILVVIGLVIYGRSLGTYIEVKGKDLAKDFGPDPHTKLQMSKLELQRNATDELSTDYFNKTCADKTAKEKSQECKFANEQLATIMQDMAIMKNELKDPNCQVFTHGGKEYSRKELEKRLADTLKDFPTYKVSATATQEMADAANEAARIYKETINAKTQKFRQTEARITKAQANIARLEIHKDIQHSGAIARAELDLDKIEAQIAVEDEMNKGKTYQQLDSTAECDLSGKALIDAIEAIVK